jgi:hypothetical protein
MKGLGGGLAPCTVKIIEEHVLHWYGVQHCIHTFKDPHVRHACAYRQQEHGTKTLIS